MSKSVPYVFRDYDLAKFLKLLASDETATSVEAAERCALRAADFPGGDRRRGDQSGRRRGHGSRRVRYGGPETSNVSAKCCSFSAVAAPIFAK